MQEGHLLHYRRTPHGITKVTDEVQERENVIKRDFSSKQPITKLLTDNSEVQCSDGKLYTLRITSFNPEGLPPVEYRKRQLKQAA